MKEKEINETKEMERKVGNCKINKENKQKRRNKWRQRKTFFSLKGNKTGIEQIKQKKKDHEE